MTDVIAVNVARDALANLPEGTSHGEIPAPEEVYLPPSHQKAMDPNNMLVTGMRGAGKTFWWMALQQPAVRKLLSEATAQSGLSESTEVRTGFGITPALEEYPDKDVLRDLMRTSIEPRIIWRTVQAWQLAEADHPIRHEASWRERVTYVDANSEETARLFQEADANFDKRDVFLLILFDALDRCSDDWKDMYRLIRGLMQTALDMRSYRRLRVKVFLRSDQVDETRIADFPDASKVLSSSVELGWPARELYGLLWHNLINGSNGEVFRKFLSHGNWASTVVEEKALYPVPRQLISSDESQREKFHDIAGPWMGRNARRGFPYTWIPNHLGDAEKRVSPRSFLKALRTAAEDTAEHHPEYAHALHFDSIKRGVQAASETRVGELREDFPWVHRVLEPLAGMTVPCRFEEIEERWNDKRVLERLTEDVEQDDVKLPPIHIDDGTEGVRQDLQTLGIFLRLPDGRVNVPDVFRVGYGLGRKGGVRPAR